jgi:hypothetical protein
MPYQLSYDYLVNYDAGVPGISVPVQLALNGSRVTLPAKLDTGAENSIFARRFGQQLGLKIENDYQQWFSTVTGRFLTFGHEITLNIAGIEFDALVFFAADAGFNRNVIGRYGGLDHLRIGLVDYEGKLYLSKYGEE